jgi:hypothetical protein
MEVAGDMERPECLQATWFIQGVGHLGFSFESSASYARGHTIEDQPHESVASAIA